MKKAIVGIGLLVIFCMSLGHQVYARKIYKKNISKADVKYLKELAQDSWAGMDYFRSKKTGFPYDSNHKPNKTNTTNIGLYLISVVAADKNGFITKSEAIDRIELILTSLSKYQHWKGFLVNKLDVNGNIEISSGVNAISDFNKLAAALLIVRQAYPKIKLADELFERIEWQVLWEQNRLNLGVDVKQGKVAFWGNGWLASDARLAVILGIGTDAFPVTSYTRLEKEKVNQYGYTFYKPAWNYAGLFMHGMGGLLIDERATNIGYSTANFAMAQMIFAKEHNYPVWGWSSCDIPGGIGYTIDGRLTQSVVTPHASSLLLAYYPRKVINNFKQLEKMGCRIPYQENGKKYEFGFRDSINITTLEVSDLYFVGLDQAMLFLSITNFLHDGYIWKLFKKDRVIKKALFKLKGYMEKDRSRLKEYIKRDKQEVKDNSKATSENKNVDSSGIVDEHEVFDDEELEELEDGEQVNEIEEDEIEEDEIEEDEIEEDEIEEGEIEEDEIEEGEIEEVKAVVMSAANINQRSDNILIDDGQHEQFNTLSGFRKTKTQRASYNNFQYQTIVDEKFGNIIKIKFDFSKQTQGQGIFVEPLKGLDARKVNAINFKCKSEIAGNGSLNIRLEIKDNKGSRSTAFVEYIDSSWQEILVPFDDFRGIIANKKNLEYLEFHFDCAPQFLASRNLNEKQGTLYLDDIRMIHVEQEKLAKYIKQIRHANQLTIGSSGWISDFNNLKGWKRFTDTTAKFTLKALDGNVNALSVNYNLGASGKWVGWDKDCNIDLTKNFVLSFEYLSTGSNNHLELKLFSKQGAVFGKRIPFTGKNKKWKKIILSKKEMIRLWGGSAKDKLAVINQIGFSVAGKPDTSGTVKVRKLRIVYLDDKTK